MRKLEDRLKTLKSPAWPENVLPPINRDLAAAGRGVFVQNCRRCHHDVERSGHRIVTTRVPISKVRTDPLAAENLMNAPARRGFSRARANMFILAAALAASTAHITLPQTQSSIFCSVNLHRTLMTRRRVASPMRVRRRINPNTNRSCNTRRRRSMASGPPVRTCTTAQSRISTKCCYLPSNGPGNFQSGVASSIQ